VVGGDSYSCKYKNSMFEMTTKNGSTIRLRDITALRVSFAVASGLIVTGVVGSIVVHPYLIALPLLVAGGLLFSAVAGWCPMAQVVEYFSKRE